jgi:hypothetical protein
MFSVVREPDKQTLCQKSFVNVLSAFPRHLLAIPRSDNHKGLSLRGWENPNFPS